MSHQRTHAWRAQTHKLKRARGSSLLNHLLLQHHTEVLEAATTTKWSEEQQFSLREYHSLEAASAGQEGGGERKSVDGLHVASKGKLSGAGAIVLLTLMVSNGKEGNVPGAHARCVFRVVGGDDLDQVVCLSVCMCLCRGAGSGKEEEAEGRGDRGGDRGREWAGGKRWREGRGKDLTKPSNTHPQWHPLESLDGEVIAGDTGIPASVRLRVVYLVGNSAPAHGVCVCVCVCVRVWRVREGGGRGWREKRRARKGMERGRRVG